jgi:hypothetical protein
LALGEREEFVEAIFGSSAQITNGERHSGKQDVRILALHQGLTFEGYAAKACPPGIWYWNLKELLHCI